MQAEVHVWLSLHGEMIVYEKLLIGVAKLEHQTLSSSMLMCPVLMTVNEWLIKLFITSIGVRDNSFLSLYKILSLFGNTYCVMIKGLRAHTNAGDKKVRGLHYLMIVIGCMFHP